MIKMCDCHMCNMTEEEQQEETEKYLEWEYEQYKKKMAIVRTVPLSFDDWLKSLPSA